MPDADPPRADDANPPERLTFFQRRTIRSLAKYAHKRPDEPL